MFSLAFMMTLPFFFANILMSLSNKLFYTYLASYDPLVRNHK
jgi:hypothetical protein